MNFLPHLTMVDFFTDHKYVLTAKKNPIIINHIYKSKV